MMKLRYLSILDFTSCNEGYESYFGVFIIILRDQQHLLQARLPIVEHSCKTVLERRREEHEREL